MGIKTSREMEEQIKLLYSQGRSIRKIVETTGVARNTVRAILRAEDQQPMTSAEQYPDWTAAVDWTKISEELGRGTTIKALHREFAPDGISYKMFWHELRKRKPTSPPVSMRLRHEPGERTYFDFCDGIPITDRATGKETKTQLLVATLPFSSFTVGEFTFDQKQSTLMRAIENAFTKIGGVTPYIVVDNLKSAVLRAHLYDPDVNKTFLEFANHMGFAVLPARPYRARDKAAVEAGVGVVQRTFFQEVRNQKFYSLDDLNKTYYIYLERLNHEIMKDHGVSRLDRFASEKSLLKPLPLTRFEISEWRTCKVHPDCHIQIERRFYSVPYQFVGQTVGVRIRAGTVEVFSETREPLAIHPKLAGKERASTQEGHYPEQKVAVARFEVKSAQKIAELIGPSTKRLIDDLLSGPQPLKYLRRAQGILRLHQAKQVSTSALEHASERALLFNKKQLQYIKDAAIFFESSGNKPAAIVRAPERHADQIFLHNHNNSKKE